MHQLFQLSADNAKQWLALFDSVAVFETGALRQFHELNLTEHGSGFMARVYQAAIEQLLENACDLQRLELCNAFRRAMSHALDAHFTGLDLADSSFRLDLAENAKQWLAFMHCMSLAEKITFQQVHAGFLSTYGDEFMVPVYHRAFGLALHHGVLSEPLALLSTLQQVLDRALETSAYHVAA
jgi:hypothetical protein